MGPGRHIRLANPPEDFDLSRETDDACVVTSGDRTISVVSLAQASVTRAIHAATEPCIARFRGDGRQVISGSQADRGLILYVLTTGKTVQRLPPSIARKEFRV